MLGIKACVLAVGLLLSPAISTAAADKTAKKAAKADKKATKQADTLGTLFKKLDTNNDGKLSPAEFAKLTETQQAIKADKTKKAAKTAKADAKGKKADALTALFKKLDTNSDGSLSLAEFQKLTEAQKAAKTKKTT